ncbi:phosphotransferase family protein [Mycolicibacterium goodii]|uniref:phosphotransferase family protein n=1 Tax=Mycolicibacterium goodii TaxID=134601 RepID=UPI0009FAA674
MTEHAGDVSALAQLLADHGVHVEGDLRIEPFSGGRSNLTFKISDHNTSWVARRPPQSGLTPAAHDVVREYRVTKALQGTRVPVPAAVACDKDGHTVGVPLSIFSYVPGVVIRDRKQLSTLTDRQVQACVTALIQTLADLHAIEPASVGLRDFGKPDGGSAARSGDSFGHAA